jgi:quercetin dioxygenase-like cupin family protein
MSHLSVGESSAVMHYGETPPDRFREGWQRRIVHTGKLMMVVIDVENGPWSEPDPPHSHPHEQIAYVADGEMMFICEGAEPQRLRAGDVFAVPSNKRHTIQLLSKRARLVDTFHPVREDFTASPKK